MGEWLTDVFFGWIYDVFYTLQKSICYLLDFIRDIFCKLAGIETVKIDGGEEEILTRFITSPAIRNAFLGVLLVGVILLFVVRYHSDHQERSSRSAAQENQRTDPRQVLAEFRNVAQTQGSNRRK